MGFGNPHTTEDQVKDARESGLLNPARTEPWGRGGEEGVRQPPSQRWLNPRADLIEANGE